MHGHAADNVFHVSGEGHFCIKGHTQVTYFLTRKYWCASNSQAGAQGSEFENIYLKNTNEGVELKRKYYAASNIFVWD